MMRKFNHIAQIVVLLVFSFYAVSPIYATWTQHKGTARLVKCERCAGHVLTGIVWLKMTFSFLTDDQDDDGMAADTDDDSLVIIKKKRAVIHEDVRIEPVQTAEIIPVSLIRLSASIFKLRNTVVEPRHRPTDGYAILSSGLSPPQYLS